MIELAARAYRKGLILTSREYFESASAAQCRIDACLASLAEMREKEGVRAQRYDAGPSGKGGVRDRMAATDRRMDYEAEAMEELSLLYAEVADARAVCRGYSAANPLSKGGPLLALHYLDLMTWRQVARHAHMSESTVREAARIALEWIDAHGIAAAREGVGMAS